jgi:IPT/TIG domain
VNEFTLRCCILPRHAGGGFGESVALSFDGATALIGGPYDHTEYYEGGYDQAGGAAWVFTRSGSTWTGPSRSVTCREQPCAVALSGDASTALVGTAVYVRSDGFPEVLSVTPNAGYEFSGPSVTITGSGFTSATAVKFGSSSATAFTINSDNSITAIAPPGTGTVDVTVTNPKGRSLTWRGDRFEYMAQPPTVVTEQASDFGPESATLHATVNPNGHNVDDCHFEFGF